MSDKDKKASSVLYTRPIHSYSEVLRTLPTRYAPLCYAPSQSGRYNMIQRKLEGEQPVLME